MKSCGWGVPFYIFKAQRTRHQKHSLSAERADIAAESGHDIGECPPRPDNGLKNYWRVKNAESSLSGLPGLLFAHNSTKPFEKRVIDFEKLDKLAAHVPTRHEGILNDYIDRRVALGFAMGLLVAYMIFILK